MEMERNFRIGDGEKRARLSESKLPPGHEVNGIRGD
jgi:hypothetical protein